MPTKDEIKSAAEDSKIFFGTFDPNTADSWYGLTDPVHSYHDLSRIPHLLITGRVGSGKSVLLRNYLVAAELAPEMYNTVHINSESDKGRATKHYPYEEATRALDLVVHSMDVREKKLAEAGHSNWDELRRAEGATKAPTLLVLVDELRRAVTAGSPYSAHSQKKVAALSDIMLRGRSLGVHLIATSQLAIPREGMSSWEESLPPFAATLSLVPRGYGRAMWYYEGKEAVSSEFAVNGPDLDQ